MIATVINGLETIFTKDELVTRFEDNKAHAYIAWTTAKEYRKYPHEMHESGASMATYYFAEYYNAILENENIAKVLNCLGMPEYLAEVKSAEYSRLLTTG